MIAIDSSSFVRYFDGIRDSDTTLVDEMLDRELAALPPIVLSELLSRPNIAPFAKDRIIAVPLLPLRPGYWQRTGDLRARLLRAGRKAKLADCLIAQACIDSDAPLITYDRDFRHFDGAGLKLL